MVDEEDLEDDKSLYDEPDPSNADTLNNGAANAKANEGKNGNSLTPLLSLQFNELAILALTVLHDQEFYILTQP